MRPDPALSGGDFDDQPVAIRLARADLAWAVVASVLVLGWFGFKLAQKSGVGLLGPTDPIALHDATPYQLDINVADWPEWMQVPGIGETLARRIVADRETNGPFESIADLQRVSGIGPETVANMRPNLIEVGRPQMATTERPLLDNGTN